MAGPDALSRVGFADEARVLYPPGAAAGIRPALDRLRCGGATDIGHGLETARQVLAPAG
ncbi:MAG: VWA domain-containing protein [Planctomycetes bacterium]|nr:VWA domain-containing protein [Planctomycetota bacterium]